jgi:hypothetical protein
MNRTLNGMRLVATCAGLGLVVGCGQPIGTFDLPEYVVETASQGLHDLRFFPGSAEFAPGEQERLAQFLLGLRTWDEIMLTTGDSGSTELDRARLNAASQVVSAIAVQGRVLVVDGRTPDRPAPAANVVLVEPLRRGQLLVACPSQYLDDNEAAYASALPRMNCANAANLAHMAVNSGDLIAPRTLGPSPGSESGAAVTRLREGRIKAPATLNSSVSR